MAEPRIDASIVPLLRHKGLSARDIDHLLNDLAHDFEHARHVLDVLIPTSERTEMVDDHVVFSAIIGRRMKWDGTTLTIRDPEPLPDTVMAALPGRRLSTMVDHPGLPDRVIETVDIDDDGMTMTTAAERVPIASIAGPDGMLGSWRRLKRRRTSFIVSGSTRDAVDIMPSMPIVLAMGAILTFVFMVAATLLGVPSGWATAGGCVIMGSATASVVIVHVVAMASFDPTKAHLLRDWHMYHHYEAAKLTGWVS